MNMQFFYNEIYILFLEFSILLKHFFLFLKKKYQFHSIIFTIKTAIKPVQANFVITIHWK